MSKHSLDTESVDFMFSAEETFDLSDYLIGRQLGEGLGYTRKKSHMRRNAAVSRKPSSFTMGKSSLKKLMSWLGPTSSRAELPLELSTNSMSGLALDLSSSTLVNNNSNSKNCNLNNQRELQWCHSSYPEMENVLDYTARKVPASVQEYEYDMKGFNKVFSAAWISDTQVIMGTKCQNLIILDVESGKKMIIPSADPLEHEPGPASQCHGIQSISINPSRTLLAVGAGKPRNGSKEFGIHVYLLPSFQPIGILVGHEDMVFSVSWIDDTTLVSGSRDKSLKTWKVDDLARLSEKNYIDNSGTDIPQVKRCSPHDSQVQHDQKVRDVVFDRATTQIFTLSADGSVKIWDSCKSRVTGSISLNYTNETVCLALDPNQHLISVGSQAHISIIDPRIGEIVHSFESLDEGWGVRSMTIHRGLLTIGGGLGRVSFYDLRAQSYLNWNSSAGSFQRYLNSGQGWLSKDSIYLRHFQGMKVSNAVYSLAYDDSYGKLFMAGGPLQLNLKGSYCGLWK